MLNDLSVQDEARLQGYQELNGSNDNFFQLCRLVVRVRLQQKNN